MILRIEARVTGDKFSTFAVTERGTFPDEIQDARIVGAFRVGEKTKWLLRRGETWIRITTKAGYTSGAFVVSPTDMTGEFISGAKGARISWGAS